MTRLSRTAYLIALVASTALSCVAHAAPKAVQATYSATMNGMGIGTISERFEVKDGTYRIVAETRPSGVAALVQRQPLHFLSRGTVTAEGLRPDQFAARRNAGDAPQVGADFDWREKTLTMKDRGKVESRALVKGTQDRLSIMYQFMFMPLENARHLDFWMTNGRKLDQYRYTVTPGVELETPLGRLTTLHLVKQRDPDDTVTEVWVSTTHRGFPVKMLIVEKNGLRFEQMIQKLELRD